jgi:tetratricopeptide (TPR) repeat protein
MAWKLLVPVFFSQNPGDDVKKADALATRAITIDPNSYLGHAAKGWALIMQKRSEEAIVEAETSLTLNPSYVVAYEVLCSANTMLGRWQKALEYVDKAEKAIAYFMGQQDEQAIEWLRRALSARPQWSHANALLAAQLALSGNEVEARVVLKRYFSLSGANMKTLSQWNARAVSFSDDPVYLAYVKRQLEGLRRAGMPEE